MITIRPSQARGKANFGWLESFHTFSFGNYYDPRHMGFASLRVINEDKIAGGQGFPNHGHRDMEIITYVLAGALEHKDSLGNGSMMRHGDVQRMSAGTGIIHSEFNASSTDTVYLLQIWIIPNQKDLPPSYEQKFIDNIEKKGKLRLIAAPDGTDGSVIVHQDTYLYATILEANEEVKHILNNHRQGWLQIARGSVEVNGHLLKAGDGIAIINEAEITIKGMDSSSELLLFDLA